jgi:hypothetical protein
MAISEVKFFEIRQVLTLFEGVEVKFFLALFCETLPFLKAENLGFIP